MSLDLKVRSPSTYQCNSVLDPCGTRTPSLARMCPLSFMCWEFGAVPSGRAGSWGFLGKSVHGLVGHHGVHGSGMKTSSSWPAYTFFPLWLPPCGAARRPFPRCPHLKCAGGKGGGRGVDAVDLELPRFRSREVNLLFLFVCFVFVFTPPSPMGFFCSFGELSWN